METFQRSHMNAFAGQQTFPVVESELAKRSGGKSYMWQASRLFLTFGDTQ
jgi:hypothetical protein